jgi:signal transduction histidine kinase
MPNDTYSIDSDGKLLFADPEDYNLELYKLHFQDFYEVYVANNGRQAISIIENTPINAIITELHLPPSSGQVLLQEVKLKYPDVVRIVLTTNPNATHFYSSYEPLLADCIILKPVQLDDLRRQIELLLRQKLHIKRLNEFQTLNYKLKEIITAINTQSLLPIHIQSPPEAFLLFDTSFNLLEIRHSLYAEPIHLDHIVIPIHLKDLGLGAPLAQELEKILSTLQNAPNRKLITNSCRLTIETTIRFLEFKGIKITKNEILVIIKDKTASYKYWEEKRKLQKKILAALIEGQDAQSELMAKELHENIAQNIIGIKYLYEGIKEKFYSSSPSAPELDLIATTVEETLKKIRLLIHNIHFKGIEDFGFLPTLEAYLDSIRENCNILFQLHVSDNFPEISKYKATNILKIIQEIVSNVVYHSKASNFLLQLCWSSGAIEIMAKDNGVGFVIPDSKAAWGGGIKKIIARVQLLSGKMKLKSKVGSGVAYFIKIPAKD